MKKFLSLVLALVMTMSLVTVSAGAKEFKDDSKINYDEAVSVISSVKVVDGYTDGSFNPQNELTRGAAAKIICNLILGPTTASELKAAVAPFKDVPTTNNFAGYIAYCAKEGIISGYNDQTFRPAAPLTGFAFMKMLLGALGYDANAEHFVNDNNWRINVAKLALGIGLNKGLKGEFNGLKNVNREEAALYAFNTLKATMVEYPEKTTVNANGAEVVLAGARKDVSWGTGTLNDGKIYKDGFVQFAEKYFGKLVREDDTDVFGRPANKWAYDKKDIGTYVNNGLLVAEYTTAVEGGDVYADITSAAADYDLYFYVDGVKQSKTFAEFEAKKLAKKNDDKITGTGNGVLTQVFVDNDAEELTIVEINTYLVETDDYNEKKETLNLNQVYGTELDDAKNTIKGAERFYDTIELDDIANIKDFEEGDMALITVANGEVQTIVEAESSKGVEISEFSKHDYVVADEKYTYAETGALEDSYGYKLLADYDKSNLKDKTFNLFFDSYGYLIGIKQVEDAVDYVFITGYDLNSSNLTNKTADANAIFSDGTTAVIKVKDATKLGWAEENAEEIAHNTWYSYTVNKDVYTLKKIDNQLHDTQANTPVIDSKHPSQYNAENGKYYYGNADTNYIVAKLDEVRDKAVISGVESVTTGVKNVSLDLWTNPEIVKEAGTEKPNNDASSNGVYSVYKNNSGYILASIVIGDDGSVTDRYAYMYGEPNHEKYNKAEDVYTWEMNAVIDGKITTVTFKSELPFEDSVENFEGLHDADGALLKLSYDKDGFAVAATMTAHGTDYNWLYEYAGMKPDDVKILRNDAKAGVLNMTADGETLWITAQEQLRGYTLADGCSAVIVEQSADGKTTTKAVEYSTVSKAIKALDTYDGKKNEANFDGTIYLLFKDGIVSSVILTDTIDKDSHENNRPAHSGVDYVKVDEVANKIYLEASKLPAGAWDKDFKASVDYAAKEALISIGYKAVEDTVFTPGVADTIKAVNTEINNPATVNFTIVVTEK